jgi:hypothetical protein
MKIIYRENIEERKKISISKKNGVMKTGENSGEERK